MNSELKRKRWFYFILIVLTIPLGLATRKYASDLPALIAEDGGDALSATCIFFGVRFVMIKSSLTRGLGISYLICIGIETLQLCRAPWLVKLRDTTPVGILLGHVFLWSDWIRYAVGVLIGFVMAYFSEKALN